MRLYAKVFSAQSVHQGDVFDLKSASASKELDGAGEFNLTFSTADDVGGPLLINENQVEVWLEQDDDVRLFAKGVIRDNTISETESARDVTVTGPDSLDALTRRSVLLGRIYNDQPIENIAADLVALVPGWSVLTESSLGNQTARFDGSSVLKALIRMAQEKGLHLREGDDPYTVEIGAFGESAGVTACNILSPTHELLDADELLPITSIKRVTNSRDVVNWIIPLGAGEGTAALTLAKSTRSNIGTMTGPDGQTLYSVEDSDSVDLYDQIEKIVTFKEIGPVANSDAAKILAANALYDAATAWLARNSAPLVTYSISATKARREIRPGSQIKLTYKGVVETENGAYTYLDVNDWFWVMKVGEQVNESGATISLEISSVDRPQMDAAEIVVGVLDAMDVRNVSVATFPFVFGFNDRAPVEVIIASTGRHAVFNFRLRDFVTDAFKIIMNIQTRPLYVTAEIDGTYQGLGTNQGYAFSIHESTVHPKVLSVNIDGTDYTTQLGGPWNPLSTDNTAIDVDCDITQILIDNGLNNNHIITISSEGFGTGDNLVPTYGLSTRHGISSNGEVILNFVVIGSAQAIVTN